MSDPAEIVPGGLVALDPRFSVEELKQNYLFGLDLSNSSGNPFPEGLFYHHLNSAIAYASSLLDIVITPQDFQEDYDYYADDFTNWGFMRLFKKPAISVSNIEILFADNAITSIPSTWIKVTKDLALVRLVPNMGSINSLIITADGSLMQTFYGCSHYPEMWRVSYRAGFETIPYELYDYVYKKAALNVIQIWYNINYLSGGSSESISIDGLSQSSTKPAIQLYNQYNSELKDLLATLRSKYDGLKLSVL